MRQGGVLPTDFSPQLPPAPVSDSSASSDQASPPPSPPQPSPPPQPPPDLHNGLQPLLPAHKADLTSLSLPPLQLQPLPSPPLLALSKHGLPLVSLQPRQEYSLAEDATVSVVRSATYNITLGDFSATGVSANAEGGMSVVFEVGTKVANLPSEAILKCMPLEVSDQNRESIKKGFEREEKALSCFQEHSVIGVPAIYGWGVFNFAGVDKPFILMQKMAGQTLFSWWQARWKGAIYTPPEPDQFFTIAFSGLSVLSEIHRLNWIHRDIHDGQFLISDTGALALIDFGGAVYGEALTRPLVAEGWIAPESHELRLLRASGSSAPLELPFPCRLDLFVFGLLLFKVAVGVTPIRLLGQRGVLPLSREESELLKAGKLQTYLSNQKLFRDRFPPSYGEGLPDLLFRMMQDNPADRPANALEVMDELQWIRTSRGLLRTFFDLHCSLSEFQSEVSRFAEDSGRLQSEALQLAEDSGRLQSKVLQLAENSERLQSEASQLRSDRARLLSENDELRSNAKQLEQDKKEIQTSLKTQLEESLKSAKQLEQEQKDLQKQIEEITAKITQAPAPRKAGYACTSHFVWCPPGTFRMGSDATDKYADADETPAQDVTLTRGFWLKATPVTQGEWQAIAGFNPSFFKNAGPNAPVERVSWFDAVWFCNKLSKKEGLSPAYECSDVKGKPGQADFAIGELTLVRGGSGYRLPTEAEWEYACRAGTTTATYNTASPFEVKGQNNAPNLDKIAWYGGNSGVDYKGGVNSSEWSEKQYESKTSGTHPVGQKQANPWGLYDMLGNVWEWCFDVYQDSYKGLPASDPLRTSGGTKRVKRGGSWGSSAGLVRSADRGRRAPADRVSNLGFRLLRY